MWISWCSFNLHHRMVKLLKDFSIQKWLLVRVFLLCLPVSRPGTFIVRIVVTNKACCLYRKLTVLRPVVILDFLAIIVLRHFGGDGGTLRDWFFWLSEGQTLTLSWWNLHVRNRRKFGALNHCLLYVFRAEHRWVRLFWHSYLFVLEYFLGLIAWIIRLLVYALPSVTSLHIRHSQWWIWFLKWLYLLVNYHHTASFGHLISELSTAVLLSEIRLLFHFVIV